MTSIMWFRRDLRLRDNPALRLATEHGPVLGLFVLDPALWGTAGPGRRAWPAASLRWLDESMEGRLCIRLGQPATVVPAVTSEVGADQAHVSNEFTPYGRARDRAVVATLPEGITGVASGTPYAVTPGSVTNGSGQPYKVFTPYSLAWRAHGGMTRRRLHATSTGSPSRTVRRSPRCWTTRCSKRLPGCR